MNEISEPLENIIQLLDEQSDEDVIEVSKGHEIVTKVVEKNAVEQILQFDNHSNQTMQQVIEKLEFFRVESNMND